MRLQGQWRSTPPELLFELPGHLSRRIENPERVVELMLEPVNVPH